MLSIRPDLKGLFRHCLRMRGGVVLAAILIASVSYAQTLDMTDEIRTYAGLSNTVVNLAGRSELHLTGETAPLSGCTINLDSDDAWLFLEHTKPSTASSTYLGQVKVNGASAVLNTSVRVVEYGDGAVIIPQPATFQPLEVFTGENFTGVSARLSQYTAYDTGSLGTMANSIRSFILKRGYTATFARNANGTGYSRNYVAQDCDLEIGVLPAQLDGQINFVRIFPWRWVSKKGIAGNIGQNLDIQWWYNWNLDQNSTLDKEYVPIRQQRWWPGLGQDWKARGASHLLGYNEPDRPDQANLAVGDAVWSWPDLLGTGLRVGSPAVSDGGLSWLYSFMDEADAADLRVDFVAVHYYRCANPADPAAAASQMYNFLKDIHDRTGRPIWITEWNNGANWTGCGDPTPEQQAAAIGAMIDMLDSTPFVERYAPYNWVEDCRRLQWDDGWPTQAGEVYRNQVSPIGYRQAVPGSGKSANAIYPFDTDTRDGSGNGSHPLVYGSPDIAEGRQGGSLALNGTDDYLVLPTHMSEGTDFTFAAWVYWNGGTGWQRIFDFGADTSRYMFLTPSAGSGQLRFAISTSGWGGEQRLESGAFPVDAWTHVAVTLSGNTGRLYVNGTLVDSESITNNPSSLGAMNNYLGKSQFSADPLFAGKLDDVLITDYALSADQVAQLLTTPQPEQFAAAPLDIVGANAGSEETGNLVLESYDRNRQTRWANDGTVANAWIRYDLGSVQEIEAVKLRLNVGASRTYPLRIDIDGTTVFSGQTSTSSGYWETAFAPTSGRYVTVTMTGTNSSGSGWLSIWEAQVWGPANEPPAFDAEAFSLADAVEGTVYNGSLSANASDPEGGLLTFSKDAGPDWLTVAPDGTLSGVPGDRDRGVNSFLVRVTDDGGLYAMAELTIDVANVYSGVREMEDLAGLASQWLSAGCGDIPACNGADLTDDARVDLVDFALLASHWGGDESIQLDFQFNHALRGTEQEDSIYTRPILLIGTPSLTDGVSGQAINFNGVGDRIDVPGYKGVLGTGSRTCSAWVKTASTQESVILSWGSGDMGQKWMFRIESNGSLGVGIWGGYIRTAATINDDQWHHVAAVLEDDGSPDVNEIALYIDGLLQDPAVSQALPLCTVTGQNVMVGAYDFVGNIRSYFNGQIDEVRLYDRALDADEVADLAGH